MYDKEKPFSHKPKGKENSTSKSTTHWRIPTQVHLWDLGLLADGLIGEGLTETVSPKGVGLRIEKTIKTETKTTPSSLTKPRASTFGSTLEVGTLNTRSNSALSSRVSSARTPDSDMMRNVSDADTTNITSEEKDKQAGITPASATPQTPMWGPYTPQKAHKIIQAGHGTKIPNFTPRTVAWSPDGAVGVVVGDMSASLWILGKD